MSQPQTLWFVGYDSPEDTDWFLYPDRETAEDHLAGLYEDVSDLEGVKIGIRAIVAPGPMWEGHLAGATPGRPDLLSEAIWERSDALFNGTVHHPVLQIDGPIVRQRWYLVQAHNADCEPVALTVSAGSPDEAEQVALAILAQDHTDGPDEQYTDLIVDCGQQRPKIIN